jgi:hypothetical protein
MHNHHTILGVVRAFDLHQREWIANSQNCTVCEIVTEAVNVWL